jgi:hypothetical protein
MFKIRKAKDTVVAPREISIPLTSGIVVRSNGITYLVKKNKLFRIYSQRCVDSWGLPVHDVPAKDIAGYQGGGVIGFREGSLVQNMVDGKIYLISDNKRRLVTDPDTLNNLQIPVVLVSESEINLHDEGESLDGV